MFKFLRFKTDGGFVLLPVSSITEFQVTGEKTIIYLKDESAPDQSAYSFTLTESAEDLIKRITTWVDPILDVSIKAKEKSPDFGAFEL